MKKTTVKLPANEKDRYSDLLLIDLLDLDFKGFFVRYKIDIVGFIASLVITLAMIGLVALIAKIGS